MLIFCIYALALLCLGIWDAQRHRGASAFFVNGRSSGSIFTGISLIASCIGGSATIGMIGLAWQLGTPAFWWLGSGACGLVLLTIFLARRVRESGAYTMPEMVALWLGSRARVMVSCVIVPAWLAILAAQFVAMGKLTTALTGLPPDVSLAVGALLIAMYSTLGGQASVIRSDLSQCMLVLGGLLVVMFWLLFHNSEPLTHISLEIVNESFNWSRFSYFMVIMGGSYVVCPMLFGRILSARDAGSALQGCWMAVVGLVAASAMMVLVGILCRGFVPNNTAPDAVLITAMSLLPSWAGILLLVALLSAVLSSADSCLITVSTVFCNDLLKKRNVRLCRLVTLLMGVGGYLLAMSGHGILDLLLMANDIYVCGAVIPVFLAMLLRGSVRSGFAECAILIGSIGGLLTAIRGIPEYGYEGMALSAVVIWIGTDRVCSKWSISS